MALDHVDLSAFNLGRGDFVKFAQFYGGEILSATLLVLVKKATANQLLAILALYNQLFISPLLLDMFRQYVPFLLHVCINIAHTNHGLLYFSLFIFSRGGVE